MFPFINLANSITVARILVLYTAVTLVYAQSMSSLIVAVALSIVIIMMDALDGYVARRRNEVTQFGGVLDITGDRIVENVFWIVFADLDVIPVWIPIIVMSRGFFTDAIRSQALSEGKTAFGESTMMTSSFGRFLVSGRFMRGFYGVIKGITFPYLIIVLLVREPHLREADLEEHLWISPLSYEVGVYLAIFTTVVSLVRGLPVIAESKNLFARETV